MITLDTILRWLVAAWPHLAALVGTSAVTALVVGSRERRSVRRARTYAETSEAVLAIRAYREQVLKYNRATKWVTAERDRELAVLGSEAVVACTLIGAGELFEQAQAYTDLAVLVAVQDKLTPADDEIDAFQKLLVNVVSKRKKAR